jgi:hypothetical protein
MSKNVTFGTATKYDIALRKSDKDPKELDDIVIRNIAHLQIERMSDNTFAVIAYFSEDKQAERVVLDITSDDKGRLLISSAELPIDNVLYEPKSYIDSSAL